MPERDVGILRELARRYAEICSDPDQERRRGDWRRHNSLKRVERPLIYVRAFAWREMPGSGPERHDPLFRRVENFLRQSLFRSAFDDDFIFEPWVTLAAKLELPGEGIWGPAIRWTANREAGGAGAHQAPIKRLEDIEQLRPARHRVDEAETARRKEKLEEAIGDVITVAVDRGPVYRVTDADISSCLADLRGLEQVMWDMYDNPEWLHRLLSIMRDGILRNQAEAEEAGDWRLCNHDNQAMSYAEELPDPAVQP